MIVRAIGLPFVAAMFFVLLLSCGGSGGNSWYAEQSPPTSPVDSTPSDSTPPDSTPPDSTPPDSTPPDSTPPDSTPPDNIDPPPAKISWLSEVVENLLPGQSVKITSIGLQDSAFTDEENILQWGREGSWSSAQQRLVWIGKRSGPDLYRWIEYDLATNTWVVNRLDHPYLQELHFGHGYEHSTVDPDTDDIFFRIHDKAEIYRWDAQQETWNNPTLTIPAPSHSPGGLVWWPGRGLIYSDRYGVRLWDRDSETWSYLVPDEAISQIGIHSFGEYVPELDVYLFGGGSDAPNKMYRLDRDNTLTLLNDAPVGLGSGGDGGVFVADPNVTGKVIYWSRSKNDPQYYEYDALTDTWSPLAQTTTADQTVPSYGLPDLFDTIAPDWNSGSSIAFALPDYGVIAFIGWWSNDIWLYKHSASAPPEEVTTFNLTSAVTGDVPFTTAVGFKKGDVPDAPTLDLDNYQVEVKRRWSDNSVKHAIFSGLYPSVAEQSFTVQVFDGGSASTGTDLTESDIVAAAPTATVSLGDYGTVSLTDLLGSARRIWLQGPEMIEAHYQADVGADPVLSVWFHVRLYKDGKIRVRTVVENGGMYDDDDPVYNEIKTYSPVITIGNNTVYDHGRLDLEHYVHTRWTAEGWIGTADPQITVAHDTRYLRDTKLVPNYWKEGPSDSRLNEQYQTYVPMEHGSWTRSMGVAGHQDQIGLLPNWDALYINSNADPRAYRAVVANAKAINSYPIVWSDPNTNAPPVISDWANWTVNGAGGSGETTVVGGPLKWELNHHPSAGYLPYLITGDYYYLESMQYNALMCWLVVTVAQGHGTDRVLRGEPRGSAWIQRTIGQLTGIAPDSPFVADQTALLNTIINYWDDIRLQEGMNELGYFHWHLYGPWKTGTMSIFQQHFWMQTLGMLSNIEALPDQTRLVATRDHMYQAIVGLFGAGGANNYCYTHAGWFFIKVTNVMDFDARTWLDSWGDVWLETHGTTNPRTCGTSLETNGSSYVSGAHSNVWGIATATLAYAVQHKAPGAEEAWQRFTSADNFSLLENSGFNDVSVWNIAPLNVDSMTEH